MTIISPVFFTGDFIKMLVMEHFWSSIIVIIFLMFWCAWYFHKHRKEMENYGMAVAVYLFMLMLMFLLFSFIALRDEQNNYDTQESATGHVSYDLINKDNVIYVYERF